MHTEKLKTSCLTILALTRFLKKLNTKTPSYYFFSVTKFRCQLIGIGPHIKAKQIDYGSNEGMKVNTTNANTYFKKY